MTLLRRLTEKLRFEVPGTIRRRILSAVGLLVVLCLLASTVSLYRISAVNQTLDSVNRISVPLGRLVVQTRSDAEIFRREMDRRLGFSHWKDAHWRPQPVPRWLKDVLVEQIEKITQLTAQGGSWAKSEHKLQWRNWATEVNTSTTNVLEQATRLHEWLVRGDQTKASEMYPTWVIAMDDWIRQLRWGAIEADRLLRMSFSEAQSQVIDLRSGLQIILGVVVFLSFLLLWLGERALRPLGVLTDLVKEIGSRGLRKEDKAELPEIPLSRKDEVSELAREFRRMATTLLEREKTVQQQQGRLLEQNRLLQQMGALNENILNSIRSVMIVTDLDGRITQANPVAMAWLSELGSRDVIGSGLSRWPALANVAQSRKTCLENSGAIVKVDSCEIMGRVWAGQWMPLLDNSGVIKRDIRGAILILEDLTEDRLMQKRLQLAENLAAVGKMSAQVAHEVRNPLHSIGLEAEMALERVSREGQDSELKLSLQSILASVDRLEKITENYLKLSRLSPGVKENLDLGEVLESVLATYASLCQAKGIRVDWSRGGVAQAAVYGDRELLEQAFGNLLKNAIQAFDGTDNQDPRVVFSLAEGVDGRFWLRIADNGPGIERAVREKLFTPFVTTKAQGTGLGLPFVRRVIEEHDGRVTIDEISPMGGASFLVVLPPARKYAQISESHDAHPAGG